MDRTSLFVADKDDGDTFSFDQALPALPLPKLRDTMERYYTSLLPFGTPEELAKTSTIIEEFERGIGSKLQAMLEKRAGNMKNWLGSWWEDYGYHLLRMPLLPYQIMAMPCQLNLVDIPQSSEYMLKVRICQRFI